MTKTTIINTIIVAILLVVFSYTAVLQNKVNATEDIRQAQARINELKTLITEAQDSYKIAEESIAECTESWSAVMNKAHTDAENYRNEISELEGFLLQR